MEIRKFPYNIAWNRWKEASMPKTSSIRPVVSIQYRLVTDEHTDGHYRRVYDSRHLQADCQEPGSTPEPYARQSSAGYLYLFTRQMQGMKRPHARPTLSQSLCSTQYTMPTLMKCALLSALEDRLNKKLCDTLHQSTSCQL